MQWRHLSVVGFQINGNSTLCSTACSYEQKRKHKNPTRYQRWESTGDLQIPPRKDQYRRKVFDDMMWAIRRGIAVHMQLPYL